MLYLVLFFFCKQKTAYEMRISDWSSDVCSSDLRRGFALRGVGASGKSLSAPSQGRGADSCFQEAGRCCAPGGTAGPRPPPDGVTAMAIPDAYRRNFATLRRAAENGDLALMECTDAATSEEHTSELQSLMRISYAVFCLTKTK